MSAKTSFFTELSLARLVVDLIVLAHVSEVCRGSLFGAFALLGSLAKPA